MMKHLMMAIVGAILSYPGFYIGKWIVENLSVLQWVAISGTSYGLLSLVMQWVTDHKAKKDLKRLKKQYEGLGEMLASEMKEVKIPKIY